MEPMLHPPHAPRADQETADQRFAHALRAALAVAAVAALIGLLLLAGLSEVSGGSALLENQAFGHVVASAAPAA